MVVLYALVLFWLASIAVLAAYLFWPSSCSHIIVDDDPWLLDIEPNFENALTLAAVRLRPWADAQSPLI